MRVRVELTPSPASPGGRTPPGWPRDPRRWTGVAIDVLRASTTLAFALEHGARRVIPAVTVDEALALRRREPEFLLCGEREGRRIEGFDLGNSPAEFGSEVVRGRTLVFASTNGSLALRRIEPCGARFCGAFVNGAALVRALAGRPYVRLVCAGKLGRFALEDTAFAGWLCERLAATGAVIEGAEAGLARALAPADEAEARALLEGAEHGRYLRSLGTAFAADVELCAAFDRVGSAAGI